MRTIRITEADASFQALLAAVEAGEELALTRYGRIVARMLPCMPQAAGTPQRRREDACGAFEGRYAIESGLISPLD